MQLVLQLAWFAILLQQALHEVESGSTFRKACCNKIARQVARHSSFIVSAAFTNARVSFSKTIKIAAIEPEERMQFEVVEKLTSV
jgi:hypothetical protein